MINGDVGFSIDETTDLKDVNLLLSIFSIAAEETVQEVIRHSRSILTES